MEAIARVPLNCKLNFDRFELGYKVSCNGISLNMHYIQFHFSDVSQKSAIEKSVVCPSAAYHYFTGWKL